MTSDGTENGQPVRSGLAPVPSAFCQNPRECPRLTHERRRIQCGFRPTPYEFHSLPVNLRPVRSHYRKQDDDPTPSHPIQIHGRTHFGAESSSIPSPSRELRLHRHSLVQKEASDRVSDVFGGVSRTTDSSGPEYPSDSSFQRTASLRNQGRERPTQCHGSGIQTDRNRFPFFNR